MLAQTCFLFMELVALFGGAAAVIFLLMGPAGVSLGGDEYYG